MSENSGLTKEALESSKPPTGSSTGYSSSSYSNYYAPKGSPIYTPGAQPGQERTALYSITPQEVYNIRYNDKWNKDQENTIKAVLVLGGYLDKKDNIPNIWNEASTKGFLNLLGDANNQGLTYNDMFKVVMTQPEGARGGGRSTTTTFNISDPATARKLVNTTINAALGRDATKGELDNLSKALRSYERTSPSVSTYDSSGASTTITTTGGSAAGREEAIRESMSKSQNREFRGVVDTQLGELFTNLLRNA